MISHPTQNYLLIRSTLIFFNCKICLSFHWIKWLNLVSKWRHWKVLLYESIWKILKVELLANLFIIFRYIFCDSDLDLKPKVSYLHKVRANAVSNCLAKTASKSVHLFDRHFVHRWTDRQTDTHTHTHPHTHIHWGTEIKI